jgi:hypothetical protein
MTGGKLTAAHLIRMRCGKANRAMPGELSPVLIPPSLAAVQGSREIIADR